MAATIELRDYQQQLIEGARAGFRDGIRRQLMVAPTGAGKTILAAKMQGEAATRGSRTWFTVHRKEIIEQTAEKFREVGIPFGVIMPGWPLNSTAMVQICSVKTLVGAMSYLPKPDGIVWDEAHHVTAGTHAAIAAENEQAWHIGLTATPERLDGRGLRDYFDRLIEGPSIRSLMDQGHLTDYRYFDRGGPQMDGIRSNHGDWNRADLGDVMGKPKLVGQAVDHYCRLTPGKGAICFEPSIKSSLETVAAFRSNGVEAFHVDGNMHSDKRREIFDAFRAGEIQLVSNVDIAGEGVDVPGIEVVIHRRPTKSLTFFLQANGRSFRLQQGKEFAYILDHAGNRMTHGLPDDERRWSLDGRKGRGKATGPADAFGIRQCLGCYLIVRSGTLACPNCGEEFAMKSRSLETVEGELFEVDRAAAKARSEEEKKAIANARRREEFACKSLSELVTLGTKRGHKGAYIWAKKLWPHRGGGKKKAAA